MARRETQRASGHSGLVGPVQLGPAPRPLCPLCGTAAGRVDLVGSAAGTYVKYHPCLHTSPLGDAFAAGLLRPRLPLVKDIVAAPITGHRVWRVLSPFNAPRLAGVGLSHAGWIPGHDQTAQCLATGGMTVRVGAVGPVVNLHDAPHEQCTCGVRAFKDPAALGEAVSYVHRSPHPGGVYAVGEVLLWGRIFEHERGYRAQHARPVNLSVVNGDDAIAYRLAAAYGCVAGCGEGPPPDPWAINFQPAVTRLQITGVPPRFTPSRARSARTLRRWMAVLLLVNVASLGLRIAELPLTDAGAALGAANVLAALVLALYLTRPVESR